VSREPLLPPSSLLLPYPSLGLTPWLSAVPVPLTAVLINKKQLKRIETKRKFYLGPQKTLSYISWTFPVVIVVFLKINKYLAEKEEKKNTPAVISCCCLVTLSCPSLLVWWGRFIIVPVHVNSQNICYYLVRTKEKKLKNA
jgi:hypothetical protein